MTEKSPAPVKLSRKISDEAALVLDYLTTGRTLTTMIARASLGITSPAGRIFELRRAGARIKTIRKRDHLGKLYAEYVLA